MLKVAEETTAEKNSENELNVFKDSTDLKQKIKDLEIYYSLFIIEKSSIKFLYHDKIIYKLIKHKLTSNFIMMSI